MRGHGVPVPLLARLRRCGLGCRPPRNVDLAQHALLLPRTAHRAKEHAQARQLGVQMCRPELTPSSQASPVTGSGASTTNAVRTLAGRRKVGANKAAMTLALDTAVRAAGSGPTPTRTLVKGTAATTVCPLFLGAVQQRRTQTLLQEKCARAGPTAWGTRMQIQPQTLHQRLASTVLGLPRSAPQPATVTLMQCRQATCTQRAAADPCSTTHSARWKKCNSAAMRTPCAAVYMTAYVTTV